ncbi:ABC transporter permease [Flexivirga sp. ID2601S]|uniref:ABC transporter permease n=1 Tax=Flexivirga aerilata TaxID=1656889 RepID=A0A849APL1_9MICO|nr:ABC transporter permease [Flexivirga aerilata]NNG41278.1 ABC transporter permease [Flexivirga aerilata]
MIVYLARRLLLAASVLVATIVLTFGLFFTGPAKDAVAYQLCGTHCTTDVVKATNHRLGLDEPVINQFGTYLKGLVAGREIKSNGQVIGKCDAPCLGWSYIQSQSVTTMVKNALPVTLSIVFGSMLIFVPLGLLLGVVSGRNRGSPLDRVLVGTSQVISNVPYYAVALILNLYLIFQWHLLPGTQYVPISQDFGGWFKGFLGIWIIFGLFNAMLYVRFVRTFMINTLSQDYVRTARSKGISERKVVWGHALRATLAPYLTLLGLDIGLSLAGAIFTEQIFNVQGLGQLAIRSLGQSDLPVIAGTVLVGAVFIILANLIVDLLYVVVDPTVKLT